LVDNQMNLLLMRHCEAESGPQDDPTRQLTETGKRQAREMGAFLARQIGRVDLVITSWMARARDTATIIAKALGCERTEETPALEPNRPVGEAWLEINLLRTLHDAESVLVVTHDPLVNELIQSLSGSHAYVEPGSIASIQTDVKTLRWLVTPKLVERDEPAVVEAALGVAEAMLDAMRADDDETGDWETLTIEQYREAVKNKQGTYVYEEILQKRAVEGLSVSGPCETCEENIDAGWIDSEDLYPSGHDSAVEVHPRCVCMEEYRTSRKRVKV
jgi:phosphohistidine phosphatase